jgi:flagellar basal-body rod modification protein FlgD
VPDPVSITPPPPTPIVVGGQPASNTPTKKNNGDFNKDDFLALLVAQLKYQNPLSPTDPTSMMQQSVQFSMLEALQQIAEASASGGTRDLLQATSMIGRRVTWFDGSTNVSGVVTGVKSDPNDTTGLKVLVGTRPIPITSILEVADVPTSTPASSSLVTGRNY